MSCSSHPLDLPAPPIAPREFRPNTVYQYLLIAGGLLFIGFGYFVWRAAQNELIGFRLEVVALVAPIVGLAFIGRQVWCLLYPVRASLTADGFEVNGEAVAWTDVAAVGEQPNAFTAWVRTRGGRTVRLNGSRTEDLPVLLAAIHHHTLDRLTTEARAALAVDESVRFGPIELTAVGLRVKGRQIGWPELGDVVLAEGGKLEVWTTDRCKVLDAAMDEVDNLRLLLRMVCECVSTQPSHAGCPSTR